MKSFIIRSVTGLVFIALVLVSFILPIEYMYILFLLISIGGIIEYRKIALRSRGFPQNFVPFFLALFLFGFLYLIDKGILIFNLKQFLIGFSFLFILPTLVTSIIELYRNKKRSLVNITVSYFPFFWIVLPLAIGTFWKSYEPCVVFAIFIMVWASDSFAYCYGMLFGKRKLFERISPKKTWEGFLLSLITTTGLSSLFSTITWFDHAVFHTPLEWMGFALVVVVFGTYGDLVQSMFKRNASVKDSGKIMPGHGGILDRFDSFLFALPAGFIYWLLFI
jgi:phosphatidate cytidylyltransferase